MLLSTVIKIDVCNIYYGSYKNMGWGGVMVMVITFAGKICPISCFPQGKSSSFADETNSAFKNVV